MRCISARREIGNAFCSYVVQITYIDTDLWDIVQSTESSANYSVSAHVRLPFTDVGNYFSSLR